MNHANYLRYMQESAFDASAAAGYDLDRYQEIRRAWLVRETDITYLRPLVYDDRVIVKTWVLDFRRVRSRRAYELRNANSGEIVAQATTDWVFMNDETERPETIPQEMIDGFFPDGPPDEAPPREKFPKAPPAPPGVFIMRRPVQWSVIDGRQHVNNANYMIFFEDAGVQVCQAHGWPMTRMMEAGFGLVARRYRIEYRQPAVFGDELEIATWASEMKRATAVRHYTIRRAAGGELLARAHVLWVWVELESGRPIRVPAEFREDFTPNIS